MIDFFLNLIPGWLILIVIVGFIIWAWIAVKVSLRNDKREQKRKSDLAKYKSAYREALESGDKEKALRAGQLYYLMKRANISLREDDATNLRNITGQKGVILRTSIEQQEREDDKKLALEIASMAILNPESSIDNDENFSHVSSPSSITGFTDPTIQSTRKNYIAIAAIILLVGLVTYIKSANKPSNLQPIQQLALNKEDTCKDCSFGIAILVNNGSIAEVKEAEKKIIDSKILDSLETQHRYIGDFQGPDKKWRVDVGRFKTIEDAETFSQKLKGYGMDVYPMPLGE